ncbi:hypothetical protein [Leifsonia poae]|uniref:hypothetical protein n=1 Tax=Leifsonia poae TaxID=110933 RepID=UPI001CBC2C8C|nr:hypothetical protein [Leifsonia poae]
MIGFSEPEPLICSRAGCGSTSAWRVEWRNPKIHSADRVKVWLACDEHVDFLREYLSARDFPVRVVAVTEAPASEPIPDARRSA